MAIESTRARTLAFGLAFIGVLVPAPAASIESGVDEPLLEEAVSETTRDEDGCEPEEAAGDVEEVDQAPVSELSDSTAADLAELGVDDELDFDLLDVADDLALLAAEDVVVSASRRLQRIEESPSAITVLTREQILASGYDNLVDLMRIVPSADVHQLTQGQGTVGIRSRSTWAGDRLLVLVDGRDVALHLFGLPMWMAMPIDLDSIERIEIIRGPGSTLYGANALQGVVNIVTRQASEVPVRVETTASAAGANTWQADLRVHGQVGSWAYWANLGWDRRAPFLFPEEIDSEVLRGRAFLDWKANEDMRARLEAGMSHLEGEMVSFVGDGPAEIFWPYLLGRLSWRRSEVLAIVDWNGARMDLDLGLRLDDFDEPTLATAPELRFVAQSSELTAHHSFDLFDGNTLMIGGSARLIHHLPGSLVTCPPSSPADFDPEDCEPTDVWESRFGVFLQDEWHLRNDLLLNLGGRLDLNSLTAQPGFSPRASVVYSPRSGQSLRFGYARAYRKPTFAETHLGVLLEEAPGAPGDMTRRLQHLFSRIGDSNLHNEYVDSLELGVRSRLLDDRLSIGAETFVSTFRHSVFAVAKNLEPEAGFGGMPTISENAEVGFENLEEGIWSYGGELQVTGKPASWIELSGSYCLDVMYMQQADPVTGELVWERHDKWEPMHRLIGSARLKRGGLRAGLDTIWFSRYLTVTRNPTSALAPSIEAELGRELLLNGVFSYGFALPGEGSLEVGMTAINLLDRPYREIGAYDDEDGRAIGGGEVIRRRGRLFVRGSF